MKQRITIFIAGCALCVFSGVLFAYEGVFDLGKVPFGAALKRTIPIENRSGAALAITSVTSSCECLKILSSPSLVASGGKAQVGFSLMPGKTGDVQYEIAVYFADIRRAPFQYLVMASVGEADTGNVVKKRKQEYCISPESVRKMPKEKLTMIDIRPGEEYARLKIPGSINVPLFAVKTKNFLNNGAVILVNEGYGYAPLEEVCGNLRQAGWDAWILNGGLNGWQQKGFPVEGSASSAGALHLMPSSALLQEKEYDNWLIIDAGRTAVKDIGISTTAVARAPSPKDARGFMAVLRKEIENRKSDATLSVVIADERGQGYAAMENQMDAGIPAGGIFFLKGGWEEYRRFLEQEKRLLNPESTRTAGKAIKGSGTRINGKPCASCP